MKFSNSSNKTLFLVLTFTFAIVLAYFLRFIQDDAFISFRYAKHFADGHGLRYNLDGNPPVEGYTNFLWTLLISAAYPLKIKPINWSYFLGILSGLGTLFFTFKINKIISGDFKKSLITIILLATNFTFVSYFTGGL